MDNKRISLLLFISGFVLLVASYNVWFLGLTEKSEQALAWTLFNLSIIPIPLSFYYIGEMINDRVFKYAATVVVFFAIGNLFDFLTGRQYVAGASEYVFAAIGFAYCYYDYKTNT